MADFVAVIRRAVDGLAKNTPEMREKVYDKARSAVRRQLENMKPAPPEAMIHRQMDKLESAIVSVEAEHAEALPAEEPAVEAPFVAPFPVSSQEPDEVHPADREDAGSAEPYAAPGEEPQAAPMEAQADVYGAPEHRYEDASLDEQPSPQEDVHQEPTAFVDTPEDSWSTREHAETHAAEPVDISADQQPDHWPRDVAVTNDVVSEPIGMWPTSEPYPPTDEPATDDHQAVSNHFAASEPVSPPSEPASFAWQDEPAPAAPVAEDGWQWPEAQEASPPAETVWQDVPDLAPSEQIGEPVGAPLASETVEGHFTEETHAGASSVRMPSTDDFPAFAPAVSGRDDFEDVLRAAPEETVQTPASSAKDPWNDLEELIGYNPNAMPAGRPDDPADDAAADTDMVPPPRPYRVAPKKRNYAGPVLALIGVIIIAAGGYALWLNRDSLTEVVGLAGPAAVSVPATDGAVEDAAEETAEAPVSDAPVAAQPETEEDTAEPASEDVAELSKFTQRLLTDGTEVDEGPGPTNGTGEGQSVAQLNAPPVTPAEAAANAPAGAAEPTATPEDAPALAGERMFLYEERVGQTAPTAIEGAISWSLQREAGPNGVQEPVVQGRVNIPGRGLTALITFKRNTDTSLPASHLVEVVFAVPPGFEGGAIDSVQRIAMKQTEQDRGDALIAVPAKITDDFHMIALNDFPDARATNLELLRSRNWMDIPLAYRNGRRALMTLQKGPAGTQAFTEAIQEWQAMSTNGSTGQ
ncbi:MAG: hypothetical protein ACK4N1_14330 [Pseudorhizobium sp.]